ncbi:hypothetical protein P4S83_18825 [Aneurinibacillus thermoaerophilus]|uniref:hypothetical protein n=1 Tax=Aneurinibacillus thermoaerophilus TaxID=143495 RepID=UPI002E1D1A80|nr:hypothetical protein [Aneurinibacillus thermoaerophilus]MED0766335.1 hypothetical protein [Aneurinibacillus thermoaerophilus]
MKDIAERFAQRVKPPRMKHGVKIATVVTDKPKVTIQLSGSEQALTLDFFVTPDAMVYRRGETMLAYPILGADVTDPPYVLLPLNTGAILAVYNASSQTFTVEATGQEIKQEDVRMPTVPDGKTAALMPNRFPKPLWVVTQVFD